MKSIKAIIKDKNVIVLEEDAEMGDYIDLSLLKNVDISNIEKQIEENKDLVYNRKLQDELDKQKLIKEKAITDIVSNNAIIIKDKEIENNKKISDVIHEYDKKINELENKISSFDSSSKSIEDKYKAQIENLKSQEENNIKIALLNKDKEIANTINDLKTKLANEVNTSKIALQNLELKHKDEMNAKQQEIDNILRQKSAMNVKQTGEDLESWCDNEVKSYMQNGFSNCLWAKDNTPIKFDDEDKGSKADYIFSIFADDSHNEETKLASVCLDMKDENPDSVNKKTNAFYCKKLNDNRIKKQCKYAVLVSNLETDKPNDLPIYRVKEYPDMYVVRPAYMIPFLSLLVSLSKVYATLMLKDYSEKLEVKKFSDLLAEFESLKNSYLDKPLDGLRGNIEAISNANEKIIEASNKISEQVSKATNSYINSIEEKLNKFVLKLTKEYKKLD